MRIAMLLAVMLAMSGPARAVVGDLNCDGVVDLKDFFIFSDNFGETGPPDASECAGPLVDDGTVVPTLSAVGVRGAGGNYNWDADAENEGVFLSWYLVDTKGFEIYSDGIPETAIHELTFSFWVREGEEKKFDEPFWVLQFTTSALEQRRKVPFEDFAALVPPEEMSSCCEYIPVVIELLLTQADGRSFAARTPRWETLYVEYFQ